MNFLERLRLLMLPIKEIDRELPKEGMIYEIGGGYGVLGFMLASKYPKRLVVEIDWNENKIIKAKEKFSRRNISFIKSDAMLFKYKKCVGAVLSDFLHHLPYYKQLLILEKISQKTIKGGVVIIKEIDKSDTMRMFLSRFWDFVLYPKDIIYYRTKEDYKALMNNLGFIITVKKTVSWFPGSTCLFICQKK